MHSFVIPVKTGIQFFSRVQPLMDSRLRGNDSLSTIIPILTFYKSVYFRSALRLEGIPLNFSADFIMPTIFSVLRNSVFIMRS